MQTPKDNCLNIGRDDITQPALFVHAPRAPERSSDRFGAQCRFGGSKHFALIQGFGSTDVAITVYRNSEKDHGELDTRINTTGGFETTLNLRFTADEMQTLACALLDAAHHLRTVPAAPYVAPVKTDAEAVPA